MGEALITRRGGGKKAEAGDVIDSFTYFAWPYQSSGLYSTNLGFTLVAMEVPNGFKEPLAEGKIGIWGSVGYNYSSSNGYNQHTLLGDSFVSNAKMHEITGKAFSVSPTETSDKISFGTEYGNMVQYMKLLIVKEKE